MAVLVSGANALEAWRAGVTELVNNHGELFHLITRIGQPTVILPNWLTDYNGKMVGSGKDAVGGVATTIFPYKTWQRSQNRNDFYQDARSMLRRARRRRVLSSTWGETYFDRLVAFQGDKNQLETAIEKMRQWSNSSRTGLVFHLSAPTLDTPRTHGGPCLQFIELIWHQNQTVDLAAVYRNHDFVDKALGNYIGLGQLLGFICHEAGKTTGELVCHSMHAYVSNLGDARLLARL